MCYLLLYTALQPLAAAHIATHPKHTYVAGSVKILHVCTCQYYEKYHFEIFNLKGQPCLGIWSCLFTTKYLHSYLLAFIWPTRYTNNAWFSDFLMIFSKNSLILGQHRYGGRREVYRIGIGSGKGYSSEATWYKWERLWHLCVLTIGQYYNPLQCLDKCVLTVGAVSGLHYQFKAHHWHYFTNCEFA